MSSSFWQMILGLVCVAYAAGVAMDTRRACEIMVGNGGAADPSIPGWDVVAGIAASYIEQYEFGPIDDNILITVVATLILFVGALVQ